MNSNEDVEKNEEAFNELSKEEGKLKEIHEINEEGPDDDENIKINKDIIKLDGEKTECQVNIEIIEQQNSKQQEMQENINDNKEQNIVQN